MRTTHHPHGIKFLKPYAKWNYIGYELNGKNVIRTIGHSTKPLSPARKVNCDRRTIVNKLLRPISTFIKVGFRLKVMGTDRNYYNEAVSYNKKHAVSGVYPDAGKTKRTAQWY